MCNQFTLHHKFRIDTGRKNLSKYSLRLWITWTRNTKIRTSLTWPNHVLHGTSKKRGKDTKTRCIGSLYSLLNVKDSNSINQDVMQSSFTIHSHLIVSRKLLWWNLEKSCTRKCMCHFRLLQRFLSKIIEWKNWGSNQHQKSSYQERENLWVSNHLVCLLRRSEKMSCLAAKAQSQERGDLWMDHHSARVCVPVSVERVDKRQRRTREHRCRSNKNGETSEWTTNRFVHSARGNRHWLQSARIVTCSCERSRKFPRSRARQKDRKSSSSRTLQADLQQNNVYNPFSNNSKEMIRDLGNVELFELCETEPEVQCSQCLLNWNQGIIYCTCGQFLVASESRRKVNKLRLDALSIPHYVIKKGRCHGARHGKNEDTKRLPYCMECVEEMLQKSWLSRWTLQSYSRSISQRPSLSWITTLSWLDRAKVHRDGRTGKTKSHVPSLYRGIQKKPRTMVSHFE